MTVELEHHGADYTLCNRFKPECHLHCANADESVSGEKIQWCLLANCEGNGVGICAKKHAWLSFEMRKTSL